MRFAKFATIVACLCSIACERDPASDVKIIERPAVTVSPPMAAAPIPKSEVNVYVPGPPFRSEFCNAPEDSTGPHRWVANGPCTFQQTANISCRAAADDFYASLLRQGPGDVTITVYLNIETGKAASPGEYSGAQLFLTVQNGMEYYHWSNDSVTATIGRGFRTVHVPTTKLAAEPPNTGTVIVSGTFGCNVTQKLDTTRIVR